MPLEFERINRRGSVTASTDLLVSEVRLSYLSVLGEM
jgi:hypothetical protein